MKRSLFSSLVAIFCALAGTAGAQLLDDGNMDALSIGTPPDDATGAGAWAFPANYLDITDETDPSQMTIVATGDFDTGALGNSLRTNINDAVLNVHLPNLLTTVINESDGGIVRVTFDIYIRSGTAGGSVYVGGDHNGGGGYSNASDRGPQITWLPDGTLNYTVLGGVNTVVLTGYATDAWQSVQLDIDMAADNFDFFHGPRGGPLASLGENLEFRVGPGIIDHIDRFSRANFGAFAPLVDAIIDNVAVEHDAGGCPADFDGDGFVTGLDFDAYVAAFEAGDPSADFDGDTFVTGLDFDAYVLAFEAGCE